MLTLALESGVFGSLAAAVKHTDLYYNQIG